MSTSPLCTIPNQFSFIDPNKTLSQNLNPKNPQDYLQSFGAQSIPKHFYFAPQNSSGLQNLITGIGSRLLDGFVQGHSIAYIADQVRDFAKPFFQNPLKEIFPETASHFLQQQSLSNCMLCKGVNQSQQFYFEQSPDCVKPNQLGNQFFLTQPFQDQMAKDLVSGKVNYTKTDLAQNKITEQDYIDAAKELGVDVARIKAIANNESKSFFDSEGKPVVRFEPHKFSQFSQRQFDQSHPHLSVRGSKRGIALASAAGGQRGQTRNLRAALALDPRAAMMASSWGRFQIMGFNYKAAGFNSVSEFVNEMHKGEKQQLKAFVTLIKNSPNMYRPLKNKNWAGFARAYNGPKYKQNNYDVKLEKAYNMYKSQSVGK